MSPYWDLLDIAICFKSDYALSHGYKIVICPIIGDANFDHLADMSAQVSPL
jgi:hypothetical protein